MSAYREQAINDEEIIVQPRLSVDLKIFNPGWRCPKCGSDDFERKYQPAAKPLAAWQRDKEIAACRGTIKGIHCRCPGTMGGNGPFICNVWNTMVYDCRSRFDADTLAVSCEDCGFTTVFKTLDQKDAT